MKPVIFIGTNQQSSHEASRFIAENTKNSELIFVHLNKEQINRLVDDEKKKIVKWEEQQSINEYIKMPENIKKIFESAENLQKLVKEYKHIHNFQRRLDEYTSRNTLLGVPNPEQLSPDQLEEAKKFEWNGWFVLKDVVEGTTMDYSEAKKMLDLIYVFGFCVIQEKEKTTFYRIIDSDETMLKYIDVVKDEHKQSIKELDSIRKSVIKSKRFEKLIEEKQPEINEPKIVKKSSKPKMKAVKTKEKGK